jgi:putative colanic acid biosysnthesis UDP-glucose lipid carrier transferase
MYTRFINLFRLFFAFLDLLAINIVYLLIAFSMERINRFGYEYMLLFIVFNMVWLASAYLNALYISDSHFNFEKFAKRSTNTFIMFSSMILLFIFIYHFNYSRLFVGLNLLGLGVSILITRTLFLFISFYLRKINKFGKKIIVLGYNELSKKLVGYFLEHNRNFAVQGYFEDQNHIHELSFLPILGNRNDCVAYAIDKGISEIYSTLSPENNRYVYDMAQAAETNMIRFKFVPDFHLFINRNVFIDYADDIPILSLRIEPLEEITNRVKKRIFDIVFSSLIIFFVLSWMIPILTILIKLTSKGPVFFVQKRSGRGNHFFWCYKFRSLRQNTEADIRQVTCDDSRFTTVGRFLRKYNLDELPQFINVFLGKMSVVGPRPHMLKHTENYSKMLNEYMVRHFVKPGITGWAQVKGLRGEIKQQEQLRKRIEHDIWYMENWSFWLDTKIIFLTVYNMFKGDKNAF